MLKVIIFLIPLVTLMGGAIFIPRWYYRKHNVNNFAIINAIYTAMGIEVAILGMLLGIVISLLMG